MHVNGTLENNLKRLRMPAMLENLNLRLKEAEETNLGYLDLLSLLVQDEIDSRESNNLNKRLKSGGFSPRMTFETYDYRFNAAAVAPGTVRDLATCKFIRDGRSLVFCGPPGIGNYVK
jgi:DNA replication protein DnaC